MPRRVPRRRSRLPTCATTVGSATRGSRSARALAPQLLEVRVELLIERTEGPRGSREAAEPATVGEQEVIQDPVDRAKERLAVALALLVGKRGADGVELLVHPAVVSGHQAELLERAHGCLPLPRPLSGRLT